MNLQDFLKRYTFSPRTDRLGGGAFGTVYKAYDNNNNQFLAIKVAEVKNINGKEFSLNDEFEAIGNLPSHPNIANYYEIHTFEQSNGVYDYALIQYYPHGNLSDLIKNESLSKEEKEDIAVQILDGLEFLHKYKVVHRDMKPSNVLMHKHDLSGRFVPKIADFGLSKKAEIEKQSRFDNSFGGGTLEYSSPEQLRGQELRFNTDLWAWAVMVYELFTGKSLFIGSNRGTGSAERDKDLFENIIKKDVTTELSVLDQKWKSALEKCLVRDSNERIKSAKDVKEILGFTSGAETKERLEDDEPATIIKPKESTPKPIENTPNIEPKKEKIIQTESNISEKKKSPILYIIFGLLGILLVGGGIWYFTQDKNPENTTENVAASTLDYDDAKAKFEQLHQAQMSGNLSAVKSLFAENVNKYYNNENITANQVYDRVVDYNKKWRQQNVEVLDFRDLGNNQYSYNINYTFRKVTETEADNQELSLTGKIGFVEQNGDFLINYIEETNRNDSVETQTATDNNTETTEITQAEKVALENKIADYLDCDEYRDVTCVLSMFKFPVEKYFNDSNVSRDQLEKMYQKTYNEISSIHVHEIDWKNLNLQNHGNYFSAQLKGTYRYEDKNTAEWKTFKLNNVMKFDQDYNIIAYYAQ